MNSSPMSPFCARSLYFRSTILPTAGTYVRVRSLRPFAHLAGQSTNGAGAAISRSSMTTIDAGIENRRSNMTTRMAGGPDQMLPHRSNWKITTANAISPLKLNSETGGRGRADERPSSISRGRDLEQALRPRAAAISLWQP